MLHFQNFSLIYKLYCLVVFPSMLKMQLFPKFHGFSTVISLIPTSIQRVLIHLQILQNSKRILFLSRLFPLGLFCLYTPVDGLGNQV